MGRVIELRTGHEGGPLAFAIRDALTTTGSVYQSVDTLAVAPEEWRRTARRVGREIKRPVRTFLAAHAVHAWLDDWPRDDSETAITDQALREVIESMPW